MVHYNSDKPVEVGVLAHIQGIEIHVAPGQEQASTTRSLARMQQAQGALESHYAG
ncbi:hypothetical protein [Methanosarcina barkeri]|uniref:hypothetical protein n=1 Tax=Methanosarcina barkeri TaxID=2208 RepID=UPI000A48811B|nr:hypothetical protein [Methanosarcina barkeri]